MLCQAHSPAPRTTGAVTIATGGAIQYTSGETAVGVASSMISDSAQE